MPSKSKIAASKIVPHLWFVSEAVEAARFYASIFPDSRVDSVTTIPAETPSGPAGSVPVVEFTLAGQVGINYVPWNAGLTFKYLQPFGARERFAGQLATFSMGFGWTF
jgi:predicted 3-demethylubiquinone-9 3-methyltransferase (glyoxalase superfamily)